MALSLITPPAMEPVTLYELKLQAGLSPTEDTDQVKGQMLSQQLRRYIATAREECENRTRRVFITQTWKLTLDRLPRNRFERDGFFLPKPPFQSIVSFSYADQGGNSQALTAVTDYGVGAGDPAFCYQVDPGDETAPARLFPGYQRPWPFLLHGAPDVVQIVFTCGYGATGAAVPTTLTQAILFLAHSYFEPNFYKDIDRLVDGLLGPYVNRIA